MLGPDRDALTRGAGTHARRLRCINDLSRGYGSVVVVSAGQVLDVEHERTLLAATRRGTVAHALAWIAEGHELDDAVPLHAVVEAVLAAEHTGANARDAVVVISQLATRSMLDPATMLFDQELMPSARTFREALEVLASKCASGSLSSISATAVRNAQHAHSGVMETLCVLAGVTFDELGDRMPEIALPGDARGAWNTTQLNRAYTEIDSIVRGTTTSAAADAMPSRPVELVGRVAGPDAAGGWERIEALRVGGVPYEILLAQRVVGSAWGQHRNRTSKRPTRAVALDLRERVQARGFDVLLVSGYGGDTSQADINELVGGSGDIGLVVRTAGDYRPFYAVTFTLAKDGGSARKSGGTKIKMARPRVPVAVVALGPGWAQRRETADLVRAFEGAIFTELTLDALVDQIASAAPNPIASS